MCRPPLVPPIATTMKTTSRPSRKTPLKAIVKPTQSCRSCVLPWISLTVGVRLVFVVHRDHPGGAEDGFVQPPHAEQDDEGADDQLEVRLGNAGHDELAEDRDQDGQRYERSYRSV